MNDAGQSSMSFSAFAAVWLLGVVLSALTLQLAVTGRLWNVGFPYWLIWITVLVGLWLWIWLGPLLRVTRSRRLFRTYKGLLRGGISFSIVQLSCWIVLYFVFRKVSLQ